MREIKFRAWNKKLEIMYQNVHLLGTFNELLANDTYECMQFTGLKDKNGKEIYEGDIITLFGYNKQVEYHEGAFGYWNDIEFISYNKNNHNITFEEMNCMIESEIIGNIYEQPDLIK